MTRGGDAPPDTAGPSAWRPFVQESASLMTLRARIKLSALMAGFDAFYVSIPWRPGAMPLITIA
jgi:hypothetical protein